MKDKGLVVLIFAWLIAVVSILTYANQNDNWYAFSIGLIVLVFGAFILYREVWA